MSDDAMKPISFINGIRARSLSLSAEGFFKSIWSARSHRSPFKMENGSFDASLCLEPNSSHLRRDARANWVAFVFNRPFIWLRITNRLNSRNLSFRTVATHLFLRVCRKTISLLLTAINFDWPTNYHRFPHYPRNYRAEFRMMKILSIIQRKKKKLIPCSRPRLL